MLLAEIMFHHGGIPQTPNYVQSAGTETVQFRSCGLDELSDKKKRKRSLPATAGSSTQLRRESCGCWILNRPTHWPIATPAGLLRAKWKKRRNMGNDSRDFGQSRVGFLLLHEIGIHLSVSCQLSQSCRSNEESVCGNFAL